MIEPVAFHTVELSDPAFEQGGLRLATVGSPALGHRADVSFWVPRDGRIGTLLILLHGVYGSHWAWSQKAGVHRTAQTMLSAGEIGPMLIAMPSDGLTRDGSAYLTWPRTDNPRAEKPGTENPGTENPRAQASGAEDVERWIVEEVPALARLVSPALLPQAKIAVAGLSMGGYGAMRLGAKYAHRFHAISAHSAITRIEDMRHFVKEPIGDYLVCAPSPELSALHWLQTNHHLLPPLRFDCGVQDPLLSANRKLHMALLQHNIPHQYTELEGGHDWSYWQHHISQTLGFVDRVCRNHSLP